MDGDLFYEMAEQLGAQDVEPFWQVDVLADYHYLKATKIKKKRFGRKAFNTKQQVQVSSMFDGLGGVCFGFCMLLLECNFDYEKFADMTASAVGKGKIRGYQHAQGLVGGMDKSGKHLDGEQPGAGKGHIKSFELTHGLVNHLNRGNFKTENKTVSGKSAIQLAPLLASHPNHYFPLFIYGPLGGHATLIAYTSTQLAYFDPNLGLVTFENKGEGSVFRFCKFLQKVMKEVYKGELDSSLDAIALRPNRPVPQRLVSTS